MMDEILDELADVDSVTMGKWFVDLRIVMTQLSQFAGRNQGSKYSRYAWVLQSMMDEILDELADVDSVTMGKWFVDFGKIVEWCGSGDETVLPDSVRAYLAENHPQELVAIEA